MTRNLTPRGYQLKSLILTRSFITNVPQTYTIQHKFSKFLISTSNIFVLLKAQNSRLHFNKDLQLAKLTIVYKFVTQSNLCFHLMISKLNILINPCNKDNKLLSIVEVRVESSGIGFQFINYQFITQFQRKEGFEIRLN